MGVQRYYPMQGTNKYESTSFPMVKSFRVDAGALGSDATGTTVTFSKGSLILGFQVVVTEAMDSASDGASLQFGFTGNRMKSAATAQASLDAVGDVVGPNQTNGEEACPYLLTADDTFDVIASGSQALSAGKFDIHVFYIPPPDGECDSTFQEFTL